MTAASGHLSCTVIVSRTGLQMLLYGYYVSGIQAVNLMGIEVN